MTVFLTDKEIAQLISERKPLPQDFRSLMQLRPKRGHRERDLEVTGEAGSQFRLVLRQSLRDALAFSVILVYRPPQTTEQFRLRRYNGKSHEHTNKLERETFYDFHVHTATERYQESGLREDSFAEPTNRFADFQAAVECMVKDCNFHLADERQTRLF